LKNDEIVENFDIIDEETVENTEQESSSSKTSNTQNRQSTKTDKKLKFYELKADKESPITHNQKKKAKLTDLALEFRIQKENPKNTPFKPFRKSGINTKKKKFQI